MLPKLLRRNDVEVDAQPEDPRRQNVERLAADLHCAGSVRDRFEEAVAWADAAADFPDRGMEQDFGLVWVERRRERPRHVLDKVVARRPPCLEALALPLDRCDAVEAKGAPIVLRWVPRDEVPERAHTNQAERL